MYAFVGRIYDHVPDAAGAPDACRIDFSLSFLSYLPAVDHVGGGYSEKIEVIGCLDGAPFLLRGQPIDERNHVRFAHFEAGYGSIIDFKVAVLYAITIRDDSAQPPPLPGGFVGSKQRALQNRLPFQIGHRRKGREEEPSAFVSRVERLRHGPDFDSVLLQIVDGIQNDARGSAQAIYLLTSSHG